MQTLAREPIILLQNTFDWSDTMTLAIDYNRISEEIGSSQVVYRENDFVYLLSHENGNVLFQELDVTNQFYGQMRTKKDLNQKSIKQQFFYSYHSPNLQERHNNPELCFMVPIKKGRCFSGIGLKFISTFLLSFVVRLSYGLIYPQ